MVISIDIGTSYSSAYRRIGENKAEPVETSTGISIYGSKYSLPSAVFIEDDGEVLVGQAAMNSRRKKPQNFKSEFKRDLGQEIPIVLGNRSFLPEDLYTELFRHIKNCAEKGGNSTVEKAFITYPASFGKIKREKIRQAAKNAGLFDVELMNEPTAAAMCYKVQGVLKDGDILLVYDFGGGTFDVSLLQYTKGTYEALAPAMGIEHCGGIDIDRAIYSDMISKINSDLLKQLSSNKIGKMRFEGYLAELAVKMKHHLSSAEHASEVISIGFDVLDYELNRSQLNEMIAGMIFQTIECCKNIIDSAGLKIQDISKVLLAGGTSRTPLVHEIVRSFAGNTPVFSDVDPDLAVAQGAAIGVAFSQKDEIQEQAPKNHWRSPETQEIVYQKKRCRKCGKRDGTFMRFQKQWYCKDCMKKVMKGSPIYRRGQMVSLYLHSNIAESAVYDASVPEKVISLPGIDLSSIIKSDDIWNLMVHSQPGKVSRQQICQYMKEILAYYKQQIYETANMELKEIIFIYPDALQREYVLCIQIAAFQLGLKIIRMMPISSAVFFYIGKTIENPNTAELYLALLQSSPIPVGVGCCIADEVIEIMGGASYVGNESSFGEFAKRLVFDSGQSPILLYRYGEDSWNQDGYQKEDGFKDVTYEDIVHGGAYYIGDLKKGWNEQGILLLEATRYSIFIKEKDQRINEHACISVACSIPTKQVVLTTAKEFQILYKSAFHQEAYELYHIKQQKNEGIEQFRIKELNVEIGCNGSWKITATDSTGAAVGVLLDESDMQYDVWQRIFWDGGDLMFKFKYK